ncbi:hypothetical protein [Oceanithermus desulfurans]|uniref:Uncharacterized protein n=2 Tax=Oceanithermus desulfurans TaxID=227924 RepID=A0A511RK50_9DEIN|nr:hypothetical protein [Oceanithermus desulfurans]MBB6029331.1 hypothetical protein [Oceanithermus desulfurans]GEM90013.1 hypothetical protein ODE01S_14470 [Oceanithermus desulfurans NBRC 100063]
MQKPCYSFATLALVLFALLTALGAWAAGRIDELLAYLASGVRPLALVVLAWTAAVLGCRLGRAARRT